MEYRDIPNINIENATIMFRNFAGREGKYNRAGDRNFCVRIDDKEFADRLKFDGWNVRELAPREIGEDPTYYLSVAVRFNSAPGIAPVRICMHTTKNVIELDEETVASLDYAEIRNIDITIRPYQYEVNGRSGVKAYLKTMHVTLEEDVWADKYAVETESPREDDEDLPF